MDKKEYKKLKYSTVDIKKTTLRILNAQKKMQGWKSIDEMVLNCVLAVNNYKRWEILRLAEIPLIASTAPNDEKMLEQVHVKTVKDNEDHPPYTIDSR